MDLDGLFQQQLSWQEGATAKATQQDLNHGSSSGNTNIWTGVLNTATIDRKTKSQTLTTLLLQWPMSYIFLALLIFSVHPAHSLTISPNGKTVINAITSTTAATNLGVPVCIYHQVNVPTSLEGPPRQAISVEDLTPTLLELLEESKMQHGTITIVSRHTTTAITINEKESRLAQDMEDYFLQLAPPDERSGSSSSAATAAAAKTNIRYKHNDIDQRPESDSERQRCLDNGWDISQPHILQAWRDQEPINAHSHLLSMLLGSSESIPVVEGKMVLGQWQSVLLVDLDGPRDRTVGIQLLGYQG
jgi:thiamine phosphate synthase YjbQ (UPF0047 family)